MTRKTLIRIARKIKLGIMLACPLGIASIMTFSAKLGLLPIAGAVAWMGIGWITNRIKPQPRIGQPFDSEGDVAAVIGGPLTALIVLWITLADLRYERANPPVVTAPWEYRKAA